MGKYNIGKTVECNCKCGCGNKGYNQPEKTDENKWICAECAMGDHVGLR